MLTCSRIKFLVCVGRQPPFGVRKLFSVAISCFVHHCLKNVLCKELGAVSFLPFKKKKIVYEVKITLILIWIAY